MEFHSPRPFSFGIPWLFWDALLGLRVCEHLIEGDWVSFSSLKHTHTHTHDSPHHYFPPLATHISFLGGKDPEHSAAQDRVRGWENGLENISAETVLDANAETMSEPLTSHVLGLSPLCKGRKAISHEKTKVEVGGCAWFLGWGWIRTHWVHAGLTLQPLSKVVELPLLFFFNHLNINYVHLWLYAIIAKTVLVSLSASTSSGTSRRVAKRPHGICTVTELE